MKRLYIEGRSQPWRKAVHTSIKNPNVHLDIENTDYYCFLQVQVINLNLTIPFSADMENQKLILVIGGTGAQGSSVVKGMFSTCLL